MQDSKLSTPGDPKENPTTRTATGPTGKCRPIKVAIGTIYKGSDGTCPVGPIEAVQNCELASWSEFENRSFRISTATGSDTVEIPIGGQQ
jgi:hypothetical protein